MDIEEDNEYLVELEKLMTSEVAATLWANNMDLLALITFDNLIQFYQYQPTKLSSSFKFPMTKSLKDSHSAQIV